MEEEMGLFMHTHLDIVINGAKRKHKGIGSEMHIVEMFVQN